MNLGLGMSERRREKVRVGKVIEKGTLTWDPEYRTYVRQIREELAVFSDANEPAGIELLTLFVVLGKSRNARKTPKATTVEGIRHGVQSDLHVKDFGDDDWNLLCSLNLVENGDFSQDKTIPLLQEYAAAGLSLLVEVLLKPGGQPLDQWVANELQTLISDPE